MGEDTTEGDGGADESVELFVTADGELEMTGSDTLDFEVLGGVLVEKEISHVSNRWNANWRRSQRTRWIGVATYACKFEDFSGQVLENGGDIDGGLGSNTHLVLSVGLQETLDTTARELEGKDWLAIWKQDNKSDLTWPPIEAHCPRSHRR